MSELTASTLLRDIAGADEERLAEVIFAASGPLYGTTHGLTSELQSLIETNQELWSLETQVRHVRFKPWRTTKLKRQIDVLNQRRQDLVNSIDAQVRKATANIVNADSRLLHESPGQLLDRAAIEAIRASKLGGLVESASTELDKEISAARRDLVAIVERLMEVCASLASGSRTIRTEPRSKVFLRGSVSDSTKKEIVKIIRERDFFAVDTKVAMDLHREFQQEMRTLREEEFKLADVYMKVVTFAGGAIVLLLTRFSFSQELAAVVIAVQIGFWALLIAYSVRMRANHATYKMLGRWVMKLRIAHASSAFFHHEVNVFGSGKGWQQQVRSLLYLAVAVTVMVLGALALSYKSWSESRPKAISQTSTVRPNHLLDVAATGKSLSMPAFKGHLRASESSALPASAPQLKR